MRVVILLALLIAAAAGATDVYRSVDANGQVHYSDQWRPGAEKIRIETEAPPASATVQAGRNPAAEAGTNVRSPPGKPANRYESVEITRPAQQEVLWNIEGQLPVSVRVTPALQAGDSLRLFLDGNLREMPAGRTDLQLQEVHRGAHTLRAEVVNGAGAVMIASPTVSFAVRQTSLLNPSRPAVP
jgi:hypothetical protein